MSLTQPSEYVEQCRTAVQRALAERYLIEGVLGVGGMAVVFAAQDVRHDRKVALKVLYRDTSQAVSAERFHREVKLTAGLNHPHIVSVFESGESDGCLWFTMTLVNGESLRERLGRERQLPLPLAVRIIVEVARALESAHRVGIVHRDIKPENLLLDQAGHVYVADFGVAWSLATTGLTRTGMAIGTPLYMSPEQASGSPADPRTDVYSLGCVLYEMLAGETPYGAASPQAVAAKHLHAPIPDARIVRQTVSDQLQDVLSRALAKSPADRFQSAGAFAAALEGVRLERDGRAVARRRWVLAGAILLLLAMGAAAGRATLIGWWKAPEARTTPIIAVLYFEDRSPDSSFAAMADGITEELIHELSGGGNAFKVISPHGVRPFRDRIVPFNRMAARLGATVIVDGSVQRGGAGLLVRAQLIDPATGTYIDSISVVRSSDNVLALTRELAQVVAASLRRQLGQEVRLHSPEFGTRNSRAQQLQFEAAKARKDAELITRTAQPEETAAAFMALDRADSLLQLASRFDPPWPQPWTDRGWVARDRSALMSGTERVRELEKGMAFAEAAIRLAPRAAGPMELRGSLGLSLVTALNADQPNSPRLLQSEADLRAAVARDSGLASAWATLSYVLWLKGSLEESAMAGRHALVADPFLMEANEIYQQLFYVELMLGNFDQSAEWCHRGRNANPGDWRFVECELTLLRHDTRGDPNPTRAWALVAELDSLDPPAKARGAGHPYSPVYRRLVAATVSARAGNRGLAVQVLARAREEVAHDSILGLDMAPDEANILLALGDKGRATTVISSMLVKRPGLTALLARDPLLRGLVSLPDSGHK
jgi:eukaryotic-like serine/threonine-protein kinase